MSFNLYTVNKSFCPIFGPRWYKASCLYLHRDAMIKEIVLVSGRHNYEASCLLLQADAMMKQMDSFFHSEEEGLERVKKGGFAMIMDRINLEYYASRNCSFTLLGEAMTQVKKAMTQVTIAMIQVTIAMIHAKIALIQVTIAIIQMTIAMPQFTILMTQVTIAMNPKILFIPYFQGSFRVSNRES